MSPPGWPLPAYIALAQAAGAASTRRAPAGKGRPARRIGGPTAINQVEKAVPPWTEDDGMIEPGKLADLVVLSSDYMAVPEDQIKDIKADLALVGGKVVFQR